MKVTNDSSLSDDGEYPRSQLLQEIAIMKTAGHHPHLVRLIACCTLPINPVCAILEYLEGGDLLAYLHNIRKSLFQGSLESLSTVPTSACSPRPSLAESTIIIDSWEAQRSLNHSVFSCLHDPGKRTPDHADIGHVRIPQLRQRVCDEPGDEYRTRE